MFFVLLSLPVVIAAGMMLTLVTPTRVTIESTEDPTPFAAPIPPKPPRPAEHDEFLPVLPGGIEIETLGNGHRITIQHTSHQ